MAKRIKKPAVKPELQREWLRRFDEDGESPPQIAKADGYDVRTVRKQIELARQEREVREARAMVLRDALEKHYRDLYTFAGKLDSDLSWPPKHISFGLKEDRMWQALREHMPRSPIWKAIQRWEHLADQFAVCVEKLEERVKVVAQERGLKFAQAGGEAGLAEDFGKSVVSHAVSLAQGHKGLKDVVKFSYARATDAGLHEVKMGIFGLGLMHPDEIVNLKTIYFELLDEVNGWEEANELQQVVLELGGQSRALDDELATIIWRRVVPGRCRYCPI